MLARSWFDALKSRFLRTLNRHERRASGRRGLAARRLKVETLEDRSLLAFVAPVDYGVGVSPQAMVSGYFNDDTVLDLATANYSDSTVSVLLGNALVPGTFDPAVTSATGAYPQSVAVGDFDGDGFMDLATANAGDVSVLLGNGDGTFNAPSNIDFAGLGTYPSSVAVGDLTGDGLMDLGVTSNNAPYYSYGYASVLEGDGLGNFSGPNTVYIGYGHFTSATAVNLDGVGADEFVMANVYASYYGGAVYVLEADGFGSLQFSDVLNTGADALSVAVGDVNFDGAPDIVTANGYYYYDSVSVMLGNGVGGFGAAQNYATGSYPTSVVLGDFTGDGNVDIATANYYGNDVSVLYGDGAGAFSTPALSATGSAPYSIVAGDFNGDLWLDAATANLGDNTVSVLINDTVWPPPPPPPPPTVSINDVSVTEGNIGTTDMTFTIYLSKASAQDITVHYETANDSADGSDFTGDSGDVTILAGDMTYSVTVAITVDRVWEPTETFTVDLSAPVNATLGDGQGIGTIYDDEPLISIDNASVTEGTGTDSVNATFTVWLSDYSDVDVTVHYATAAGTAGGSDFTATSGDVTIPAGQLSATFTVVVLGDRLGESTETFVVNLSAPVNAGIADNQGVGTILDNEPRISINNVRKNEGNGKGSNNKTLFVFTVSLSAAYDQAVTVNYATAPGTATAGSDYQTQSGTLTFAPGVTSMTITIIVIADKSKEADETFFVNLSEASSNALIFDEQGIGTILNDDRR